MTSSPLVLPLLIIITGKHTEQEEVVGEKTKIRPLTRNKSGVNRRRKVDKKHGTWMLPTFLFTVPMMKA